MLFAAFDSESEFRIPNVDTRPSWLEYSKAHAVVASSLVLLYSDGSKNAVYLGQFEGLQTLIKGFHKTGEEIAA